MSTDVIAERLGRNRPTNFHELRRNHYQDAEMPKVVGYFGVVTSMKALARRLKDHKLIRHTQLPDLIIDGSKVVVQSRYVGKRNDFEHFQNCDARKA